jgi:hypothetical protein
MSNKKLIIIFGALLGLYLLSRVFMGKQERTYDPQLVAVDTAQITEIKLHPKSEGGAEIIIHRTADGWETSKGDMTVKTPYAKVSGLLAQLTDIRSERVVSRSQENWSEYEVDEKGSRVEVFAKKKKVADFIVGTFKFDQAKRSASSYLRTADKDDVYLVEGFMSMTFNQGFNTFRNNTLTKLTAADILEVSLTNSEGRTAISKNPADGQWYRNGMEQLDSVRVAQFVAQLSNVTGSEFVDAAASGTPAKTLEITGNNLTAPVKLECFVRQDTTLPFVIRSSMNPDARFGSDSTGVYQKLFVKFEDILAVDE